jgi:DNA-binding GntR family transcriptional regulator
VRFAPLQQRTTLDDVADVLREAILDGSLKPGSQLREAHIASELGVSRAPVREALRRLEEEGLVAKFPYRGAYVAEVSDRVIDEIASLRLRLEPFAAELALPKLRSSELGYLREVVGELTDAARKQDLQHSIAAHLAFHRAMYEAADHQLLLSLWSSWESQLRLALAADMRSYSDPVQVADVHARLLKIIEDGDIEALNNELAVHIHSSEQPPLGATKRSRPTSRRRKPA